MWYFRVLKCLLCWSKFGSMNTIELADYRIHIGDFWANWNAFLAERNYTKVVVLVDENTKRHCLPIWEANTSVKEYLLIKIEAGEQFKNIETCQKIWTAMMEGEVNRSALLVNLGGGVIGDMGGFCASTYKRGIDFVQFPSTLLSQVDASIGGKLGIDFNHVKNSVGVFRNPQAVFIYPQFLKTLDPREIRSGFAEIIKHSLIADAVHWAHLSKIATLEAINWPIYLAPSLEIKKDVVTKDPFEKGLRKALNFGHTIGHAIESVFLETAQPLLHGEAIAIGMICEAYLSHKVVGFSEVALKQVETFILKIYGKVELNPADYEQFLSLMKKDKKNESDEINFTMLPEIGAVKINQTASRTLIQESLDYYNGLVSVASPNFS